MSTISLGDVGAGNQILSSSTLTVAGFVPNSGDCVTAFVQFNVATSVTAKWDPSGDNLSMTQVGSNLFVGNIGGYSVYMAAFKIEGVNGDGATSKSITFTTNTSALGIKGNGACWSGVGSVGTTLQSAQGTNTHPAVTVNSGTGHVAVNAIGGFSAAASIPSYTQTADWNTGTTWGMAMGHAAGASTVGFGGTLASSGSWGAIGFDLIPDLTQNITPSSIASAQAFGTMAVSPGDVEVDPTAVASVEAFGFPAVAMVLAPGGIASAEAVGGPTATPGDVTIPPTGIASLEAVGEPLVSLGGIGVRSISIDSAEAFGTATVSPGAVTVTASGISSLEAFGGASLAPGGVTISPTGIGTGLLFGTSVISAGDVALLPTGIASQESLGRPTVLGPLGSVIKKLMTGLDAGVLTSGDSTTYGAFDQITGGASVGTTLSGWAGRLCIKLGKYFDANVAVRYYNGVAWTAAFSLYSSPNAGRPTLTLYNGAVNSTTTANGETYLATGNLLQYLAFADAMLIGYGFNDIGIGGKTATTFPPALETYVSHIQAAAPNLPVIVTTQSQTTNYQTQHLETTYAAMWANVATDYLGTPTPLTPPLQAASSIPNLWMLDTRQAFNGYTLSNILHDGLHPNYLGYSIQSEWMGLYLAGIPISPVMPTGIPSAQAFGTASITRGPVEVLPSGVGTLEAFGSLAIAPGAVTLAPAGVASQQGVGEPLLDLGDLRMRSISILSGEAFGIPAALRLLPPANVGVIPVHVVNVVLAVPITQVVIGV